MLSAIPLSTTRMLKPALIVWWSVASTVQPQTRTTAPTAILQWGTTKTLQLGSAVLYAEMAS